MESRKMARTVAKAVVGAGATAWAKVVVGARAWAVAVAVVGAGATAWAKVVVGTKAVTGARAWAVAAASVAAAVVGITACLGGTGRGMVRYSSQHFDLFDTVTVFTAYAEDEAQFDHYDEIMYREMEEYHRLCDIYHDYEGMNNVKTINDNAGVRPVEVDGRLISLLEEALSIGEMTGGAVNIAMGSVLSIWHEYREAGRQDPQHASLPPKELLKDAAEHMDPARVRIDKQAQTVYLEDPDMSLDLGAVAKGYAAEQVCRKLREEGLESGMVNAGGNVRAIGTKPGGEAWSAAVQSPEFAGEADLAAVQSPEADSGKPYLCTVALCDAALVTSGSYQRYYTVDGIRYHHIIHPQLLTPWNRYVSVTVLCGDSGLADGLSTALFNMEPEEGRALVEKMADVEVLWVYPDRREDTTEGFQALAEADE